MVRIKLSTEDIFVKNNQRIKIITDGIDTADRFDDNPVMLFEHNPEKIIGKWSSIERFDNVLSAIPDFDEDELSVDIGNKLKRGSLKSASVGIEINDAFLEGDVLIISKSTILEASIVGIPANKHAKTVDFSKGSIMLFSNGTEVKPDEYIKKLNNMKKKKENEDVKIENLDAKIEEIKVEDKVELTEVEVLNASIVEKDSKIEDLATTKVELNLNLTNLNKEVDELKSNKETLMLSITDKNTVIGDLELEIKNLKGDKLDTLLNLAVSEGKISNEAKEDFLDLSFDKAKSILDKIIPNDISLSDTLKLNRNEENKTYSWYLKNDLKGLRNLAKENPTLYKQIEKDNK